MVLSERLVDLDSPAPPGDHSDDGSRRIRRTPRRRPDRLPWDRAHGRGAAGGRPAVLLPCRGPADPARPPGRELHAGRPEQGRAHGCQPRRRFHHVRRPTLQQAASWCASSFPGRNLHGANLEGPDTAGVGFQAAQLAQANLRGADLRGAKLRGANLAAGRPRRRATRLHRPGRGHLRPDQPPGDDSAHRSNSVGYTQLRCGQKPPPPPPPPCRAGEHGKATVSKRRQHRHLPSPFRFLGERSSQAGGRQGANGLV